MILKSLFWSIHCCIFIGLSRCNIKLKCYILFGTQFIIRLFCICKLYIVSIMFMCSRTVLVFKWLRLGCVNLNTIYDFITVVKSTFKKCNPYKTAQSYCLKEVCGKKSRDKFCLNFIGRYRNKKRLSCTCTFLLL